MAGPRQTTNATGSGAGARHLYLASNANATGDLIHEFGSDESTPHVDLTQIAQVWKRVDGTAFATLLRSGALILLGALTATNGVFSGTLSAGSSSLASLIVTGTLGVAGASSFAAMSVSGAATFLGTLTVGGVAVVTVSGAQTMTEKTVATTAAVTGAFQIPAGTTAQRPSSPVDGYMRYNTELGAFEGRVAGAWAGVGGGVHAAKAAQTPADLAAVTLGSEGFQKIPVSGASSAPVQLSSTPFGATAPAIAIEVVLVGQSNTAPVTLEVSDSAKGFAGNGRCVLTKGSTLTVIYDADLDRWLEKSRCIISLA